MSWDVIGMLALVAFCAGFFDAIAGGGGLITLPALLLASVDPISAIATNKFQAASATISATVTFARKGMIEWREGRFLVICGFVGGASGALLVSSIDKRYLEVCVPIMLILVAIYFALSPKLANEDPTQENWHSAFFVYRGADTGLSRRHIWSRRGLVLYRRVRSSLRLGHDASHELYQTCQCLLQLGFAVGIHYQRGDHLADRNRHGPGGLYRRAIGCARRCSGRPTANQAHVDRGLLCAGYQASERGNQSLARCLHALGSLALIASRH